MPTRNNERYALMQLDSDENDFDTFTLNELDELELDDQYIRQRGPNLEDDDEIIQWADKNLPLETDQNSQ